MKTKGKTRRLSEKEIDEVIVAQAEEDSAWGKPLRIRKTKPVSRSVRYAHGKRAAPFNSCAQRTLHWLEHCK